MEGWLSCQHCALRHRAREDGRCPRCQGLADGAIPIVAGRPEAAAPPAPWAYASVGVDDLSLDPPRPSAPAELSAEAAALGAPVGLPGPTVETGWARPKVEIELGAGFARQLLFGLAFSLVGAGLWAAIVHWMAYEVGFVAAAIGVLAALGVVVGAGEFGDKSLPAAVIAAVTSFFVGKAVIGVVVFASLAPAVAEDLVDDPAVLVEEMLHRMVEEGRAEPWVLEPVQAEVEAGLLERTLEVAQRRVDALGRPERAALAVDAARREIDAMSLWARLGLVLGPFDALWLAIAVFAAIRTMARVDA